MSETSVQKFLIWIEKLLIVISCIIYGYIVGAIAVITLKLNIDGPQLFLFIICVIIFSILNPFVAALVVLLCEKLRFWAYAGKIDRHWKTKKRLIYSILWPATLVIGLIIFTFLGIIQRGMFKILKEEIESDETKED